MYHIIALYRNHYYYLGCGINHAAAIAMYDQYMLQYPKLDKLHLRYHPLDAMLEYVKDFKPHYVMTRQYAEDNMVMRPKHA